jgi:hypothetical protein
MTEVTVMVRVEEALLKRAREKFPSVRGLTATGLVDYLIRLALEREGAKQP